MHMNDSREIAADPATVFAAIVDAETLKAAVPGAQEVEGNAQDGYTATVTQKVGPVKATFKGVVTMSDIVENQSITISGEGKGGAAGFAKGGAKVTLEPIESGTRISYDVDAKVGGKIAQLGSRLIDGFAKKMADQFFENLKAAIEGPAKSEEAEMQDEEKRGLFSKLTGRG